MGFFSFSPVAANPSARKRKIMFVFGTRPEAIKMAPVIRAVENDEHFESTVVVTGQHREMLDPVLELFEIEPDYDLAVMSNGQTLADITTRTLDGLSPLIESEQPDALVVQGDTTAAMVGAMAAFYSHVPCVHLEAGLRSGDMDSPFPEEFNRRTISLLATLHLAPTQDARNNLLREGVDPERILVVGNTVIDALYSAVELRAPYNNAALEALEEDPRRVILVTAHRRESWGKPMQAIALGVAAIAQMEPDVVIVLPMHRNPIVREALVPRLQNLPNVILTEPLDYGPFSRLINRAHIIVSDSGGLQEEGPALGKPVLVTRDTTERPEGIAAGAVRLVGTQCQRIVTEVSKLLHDQNQYAAMASKREIYGDGRAARRSLEALGYLFGLCEAPLEFGELDQRIAAAG